MDTRFADLDGDGRTDVLWSAWRGGAVIGVCTAAGVRTHRRVGGQREIFEALDVQPDGRAEIASGGTTVSAGYTDLYLLKGDHIVRVRLATGGDATLVSGLPDGADRQGRPRSYVAWGCADVQGGPAREIVTVKLDYKKHEMSRTIYRLRAARLEVLSSSQTTIPRRYADVRDVGKVNLHVGDTGCQNSG